MPPEALQIILIEDSPFDREMTMRALERAKILNPVVVLSDGEEALEFFFGEASDVEAIRRKTSMILLDLKLPRVDGAEVLRRLKGDRMTRPIPVVIMTSSAEERDRLTSYDVGANSYIVKPIDFEQFAAAVAELGFYWCVLNAPPDGAAQ